MIMDVDFSTEVAAGIAFLNATEPEWRSSIDPDRLAMVDPYRCVLGLVFGEFWRATRAYSGASPASETYFADMHTWAAARGFIVPDHLIPEDDDDDDGEMIWDELDFTWRVALDI
jgi:hypothetical protein